jgi:hypothetical protein
LATQFRTLQAVVAPLVLCLGTSLWASLKLWGLVLLNCTAWLWETRCAPLVSPGQDLVWQSTRRPDVQTVAEQLFVCKTCWFCVHGHYNKCDALKLYGQAVDGAMATFMLYKSGSFIHKACVFTLFLCLCWHLLRCLTRENLCRCHQLCPPITLCSPRCLRYPCMLWTGPASPWILPPLL